MVLERQIDHWVQEQPVALYEARLAWRQPLPSLEGRYAVLYSMQAANPRPDAVIQSIDLIRTSDRAVPAVLGINLGEVVSKSQ